MLHSVIRRSASVASLTSTIRTKFPAASRTIRPRPPGSSLWAVPKIHAGRSSANRANSFRSWTAESAANRRSPQARDRSARSDVRGTPSPRARFPSCSVCSTNVIFRAAGQPLPNQIASVAHDEQNAVRSRPPPARPARIRPSAARKSRPALWAGRFSSACPCPPPAPRRSVRPFPVNSVRGVSNRKKGCTTPVRVQAWAPAGSVTGPTTCPLEIFAAARKKSVVIRPPIVGKSELVRLPLMMPVLERDLGENPLSEINAMRIVLGRGENEFA